MVAAYNADGTPATTTKADGRTVKRSGKAKDARLQGLYDLGRARQDPGKVAGPEEQQVYEAGLDAADEADRKPKKTTGPGNTKPGGAGGPVAAGHPEPGDQPPKRTPTPGRSFQMPQPVTTLSQQGSGFLLGLVGYAIVINYLRHGGGAGVHAWFDAKFLNKLQAGESSPAAAAKGSATASPPTGAAPTASTVQPI